MDNGNAKLKAGKYLRVMNWLVIRPAVQAGNYRKLLQEFNDSRVQSVGFYSPGEVIYGLKLKR